MLNELDYLNVSMNERTKTLREASFNIQHKIKVLLHPPPCASDAVIFGMQLAFQYGQ